MKLGLTVLTIAVAAGTAAAQPAFVMVPGSPSDVSDDGTIVVGGSGTGPYRWVRTGGTATFSILQANTLGGFAYCSSDGATVIGVMPNTNVNFGPLGYAVAGKWTTTTAMTEQHDPTVFFSHNGSNTISSLRNASRDARYFVGLGYLAGGSNGFRPMMHDTVTGIGVNAGGIGVDPARAICVSDDGMVIGGDNDLTGSAQRPAIWRNVAGTYVGQVIEPGTGGPSGATVNCLSADGSLASGRSYLDSNKLVRWEYNAGTNSYDKVILATALTPPGATLTLVTALAMTPDGQTIFGNYNPGGRAFIWEAEAGMQDLTSTLLAEGMTGMPMGNVIGSVLSCTPDGQTFVGAGGPGSAPFIVYRGGGVCVAPAQQPATSTTTISMCSRTVSLNASIVGSGPFTYAWRKNGSPIVPGPTGNTDVNGLASTYAAGLTPAQMRINNAGPLDAGSFDCVVTGACGSVTIDPIVVTAQAADLYDTCDAPYEMIGEQLVAIPLCGLYVNQGLASCAPTQRADAWIRYTPSFTGEARFTTCAQIGFDMLLSVHSDCTTLVESACDNSYCTVGASIQRYPVEAGVPVLVRLGAVNLVTTPIQLNIFQAPPLPANDECANAIDVGEGATFGNNTEATTSASTTCVATSGKDVWYRYIPSANGTANFDTCTSGFNTVLSLYSACGQPLPAPHDCNDNANVSGCFQQSRIQNVPVWFGVPILVRVSGSTANAAGAGGITLNISITPRVCDSADFDNDSDTGTDADIEAFFACLGGSCCATCGDADFDNDGDTGTDGDIEAFFRILGGGIC